MNFQTNDAYMFVIAIERLQIKYYKTILQISVRVFDSSMIVEFKLKFWMTFAKNYDISHFMFFDTHSIQWCKKNFLRINKILILNFYFAIMLMKCKFVKQRFTFNFENFIKFRNQSMKRNDELLIVTFFKINICFRFFLKIAIAQKMKKTDFILKISMF